MSKIIKLENLIPANYDQASGKESSRETTEYVCGACRHLVRVTDKFCWQCGIGLEQSSVVEHYHKGKKLTKAEFQERRKLCH